MDVLAASIALGAIMAALGYLGKSKLEDLSSDHKAVDGRVNHLEQTVVKRDEISRVYEKIDQMNSQMNTQHQAILMMLGNLSK